MDGWTVTSVHNHRVNGSPKTLFMHGETKGDINQIIDQANEASSKTWTEG
jgi:Domain of Unknown Function (DUF1259)